MSYRVVTLEGEMSRFEAGVIRRFLSNRTFEPFPLACLAMDYTPFGIGKWVNEDGSIHQGGYFSAPDVSLDDIEVALTILASKFPTLRLKADVSDALHHDVCEATFQVGSCRVFRCFPERQDMPPVS